MHHNGSDDQNIAGKYSTDNYRFHQSIFQKYLFSLERRSEGSRILTLDPRHRDHRFVSIHLKQAYLTCFKREYPLENTTQGVLTQKFNHLTKILTIIFRECMITICSRCCKSGNIPQCSTITSHHQHFATNVSRFKSRMG